MFAEPDFDAGDNHPAAVVYKEPLLPPAHDESVGDILDLIQHFRTECLDANELLKGSFSLSFGGY